MKVTATARELYEAINHKYALATASENMDDPLSERLVKAIARDINRNISGIDDYRHGQVIIRGAEHLPPGRQSSEPAHDAARVRVQPRRGRGPLPARGSLPCPLRESSPFEDGNGRTGRILVNRGLMRAGLAPVVILVEERAAYMDLLARSDYDGLAAMLRRLSEAETERMERFAEL